MDCIFNRKIPKSTPLCYIARPTTKTFITELAHSYSSKYD